MWSLPFIVLLKLTHWLEPHCLILWHQRDVNYTEVALKIMIIGYEMHSLTNIKIYTFFNSSENNLTLHFKEHTKSQISRRKE